MHVVMNSYGYLCMTIPIIKRRDLEGYKKIITCKSCSYIDPKYLTHNDNSKEYLYNSFTIESDVGF